MEVEQARGKNTCTAENRCSFPNVRLLSSPFGNLERQQVVPWQEETSPALPLFQSRCCGPPGHSWAETGQERTKDGAQTQELGGQEDHRQMSDSQSGGAFHRQKSWQQKPEPTYPLKGKFNSRGWCSVPAVLPVRPAIPKMHDISPETTCNSSEEIHQRKTPRVCHLSKPGFWLSSCYSFSFKARIVAGRSCSRKLEYSLAT